MKIKKLTSILFCIMLLCLAYVANAEIVGNGSCGENATWELNDIGTLTISGEGDMTDYLKYYETPWYYKRSQIKTIVIDEKITSIGDYAFYDCKDATEVTIPEGIVKIGKYAFYNCQSMNDITIPTTVESIGNYAFWCCYSFTNIIIPKNVQVIGSSAFRACDGAVSVYVENGVESIGSWAFNGCEKLSSITLPDSIKGIGYVAFEDTAFFDNELNWKDDVLYIGKHLIKARDTISGSYAVKEGTKTIAYYAFAYCDNLEGVTMPNTVTIIGASAFCDCDNLRAVKIPANVTYIESNTFGYCKALETVAIPEGVTYIDSSAFYECNSLNNVTIPKTVEGIGNYAFEKCTSLTDITIENGVKSIGNGAFISCGFETVIIPETVIQLGGEYGETVFTNCMNLKNIVVAQENQNYASRDGVLFDKEFKKLIDYPAGKTDTTYTVPDTVEVIGRFAFLPNSYITSITIPDSVISMELSLLGNCTNLTDLYYNGTAEQWDKLCAEDYCPENLTIHFLKEGAPKPKISAFNVTMWGKYGLIELSCENIPEQYVIYVAGYKEDGSFSKLVPLFLDETGMIKTVMELSEEKYFKAFMWCSLQSLKPLCDAKHSSI